MKVSLEFKENVVRKVMSGCTVKDVCRDVGVSSWSVYAWLKQHRSGIMTAQPHSPGGLSLEQKYQLLLESKTLTDENAGEWLRKNGLHSDHLEKWKKEIGDAMNKNSAEKIENNRLKQEIVQLQKEIARKDRALAEAAALLTLKKKYQYLWEGEEK